MGGTCLRVNIQGGNCPGLNVQGMCLGGRLIVLVPLKL